MNDITQIADLISGGKPNENVVQEGSGIRGQELQNEGQGQNQESPGLEREQQENELREGDEVLEAQPPPEGDEQEITSFNEFMESMEFDPKQIYQLRVGITDDSGQQVEEVNLSQLKDFYRENKLKGADIKGLQETNVQLRDQLTQVQQFQQTAPPMAQELQQADMQIQAINQQYNSIDWPAYEQQNPGEAALQRQKLQEAYTNAVNSKNAVAQNLEHVANERKHQFLAYQQSQVRQLIPEWSDSTVAQREATEIAELLKHYGFQEQEINNIDEARVLRVMRDYMQLKNKVESSKPQTKKVHNQGGTLTAGTLKLARKSKEQKRSEIVAGMRGNTDTRQQAKAIEELLRNR